MSVHVTRVVKGYEALVNWKGIMLAQPISNLKLLKCWN